MATLGFVLLISACAVGVEPESGPLLLDARTPEKVDWKRTAQGFEVAGIGTSPDSAEIAVIAAAIQELPDELLGVAQLGTIYRIPSDPEAAETEALAFARGHDVYLTDDTFAVAGTRFEMVEVLGHELAHVAQYQALSDADIERLIAAGPAATFDATSFVAEFATAVGWSNRGTADAPVWELQGGGTTTYGATSPAEDMADSVARVIAGRAEEVSTSRRDWVAGWLGTSTRALAEGKPHVPAPARAVNTGEPMYDQEAAARLSPGQIDAVTYALDGEQLPGRRLAVDIESELGRRGIAGRLLRSDDDRIERYSGQFIRGDGLQILVELWDFRNAPGFNGTPEQPLVTYVTLY